jgi:TonB family protein
MTWAWRQPYYDALREKDPSKLSERLVIAEKAIVQRLQELAGPAEDLPEGQALREALNRLYALYPHEHHPPGQIQDEDTDSTGPNWMRLVLPVGLGLTLASATAWMAARRNDLDPNDARRIAAAAQTKPLSNSRSVIAPDSGANPVIKSGSNEHGSNAAAPGARGPHLDAKNRAERQGVAAPSKSPDLSLGSRAVHTGASSATSFPNASEIIAKPTELFADAPGAEVESARPSDSVDDSPVSRRTKPAAQAAGDSQSTSSDSTQPQEKSERPRGTVAVSASTYPSIRVPTEIKSEASSAESLQIGQLISRTDPIYPEDAERQNIQGTVKLRAFVGKDGAVDSVEVIGGPPLLASAAADAVRQWRYKPTFLGGHAIEVAEEVTIVFRLVNASDDAN